MNADPSGPRSSDAEPTKLKIYLLPNLMTAGNLFCGFLALTKIVEADINASNFTSVIRHALFYILLACIFDMLDGRVARMGGYESPFGREFDSIADIVSFGVAPAFLVHRIVLRDVFTSQPQIGWFIASVFLICGAFRLARFNCLAAQAGGGGGNEFLGFPIPAAAGLVASLTLLLMYLDDRDFAKGTWRFALPFLLVFLSIMMVSEVKYPAFKKINWRTRHPFARTVVIILCAGLLFVVWDTVIHFVLPLFFTAYLLYGLVRSRISRKMIAEIEEESEVEG
jgi:CDP-diacylglycerol---serine O-phosphatidyltransferase